MLLKSMIYSDTLNTDILTFFEAAVIPSLSLLTMLFLCCKGSLLAQCSICCPSESPDPFLSSWWSTRVCWCMGFSSPDLEVCIVELETSVGPLLQPVEVLMGSTIICPINNSSEFQFSKFKIFCSKYEILKKTYFD